MTYNLLADAFLLSDFSLSVLDKQPRRPDGVRSLHLYLCKSFSRQPGNRSAHHFSSIVMFSVFSLCCDLHSGPRHQAPSLSVDYWQMIYWQVSTFVGRVDSFSGMTPSSSGFLLRHRHSPKTSRLGAATTARANWQFLWDAPALHLAKLKPNGSLWSEVAVPLGDTTQI